MGSLGSSPLARGLPMEEITMTTTPGIIPARAGFTTASAGGEGSGWDHPRSRGVYATQPTRGDHHDGSSPLARGLPR